MEFRQLGKSGLKVSVVGLGALAFGDGADQAQSARVISRALDLGVNFIDTANKLPARGAAIRRRPWRSPPVASR